MKSGFKFILAAILCNAQFCQAASISHLTNTNEDILNATREIYLSAEQRWWDINSSAYQQVEQKLHHYPLLPYLQSKVLRQNIALKNEAKFLTFLETYENTPLDYLVRTAWLNHLHKSKQAKRYMQVYRPDLGAKYTCLQLRYQWQDGAEKQQILKQVTNLWLHKKSQPDECDPLFKQWQDAGMLTVDLLWQRIVLAQTARQYMLSRYLTKKLPPNQAYLKALWEKVKANPKRLNKLDKFNQSTPAESLVIAYGLKKLVWQDVAMAVSVYQQAIKQQRFDAETQKDIYKRLTIAAARSDHPNVIDWLAEQQPDALSEVAQQWQMAKALSDKDYLSLLQHVEQNVSTHTDKRQYSYWHSRAKELAQQDNPEQIEKDLTTLAQERSYYGFLAAARTGSEKTLNHQPIVVSAQASKALPNYQAAQRAFELFALNRFYQARREWNHWVKQLPDNEHLAAAQLAFDNQWYSRPIVTLSRLGLLNDTDMRFPMPFTKTFTKYAKQHQVDLAWVYAIARKESIFMPDAKSPAGAYGLMQVMPATANEVGRKKFKHQELINIDTNVKLGINYLSTLLKKYDNNIVLATAAYNAGPGNVNKWLRRQPTMPADAWIETIPFKETRNYVKSVMAYTEIYQQKVGQGMSPFNQLTKMDIQQAQ
ncbi:transglycosylase SLT domain-containing protein [Thalassotalea aquiviva]|uniref:lytic transglycosylase domain-containing protein n=1 Tax=Thalassotalea aquiviva TaxID=3242415 RepID=UPI00352AC78F